MSEAAPGTTKESGEPIAVYTDGACSPNPGPGGYGVLILRGEDRHELSGGFQRTTNNRMELYAAIVGLHHVCASLAPFHPITVYSDSRYVVDMFNGGYARKWRSMGWMRNRKDKALNPDLWARLLDLTDGRSVRFEWVKSHNEHPENERCDSLAVSARQRADLPADDGYEGTEVLAGPAQQGLFEWST